MSLTMQCCQLQYKIGNQLILNDISASFTHGCVSVITGPSGAGKSTLLSIIAGIIPACAGSIHVGKQSWSFPLAETSRAHKMPVGMIFQQHHLWPHLNVMDNLTLAPIKVLKMSKQQAQDKAEQYLAEFGLAAKARAFANELSGGQQQRVAIIRSLMMPYPILVFDEPTASLDPEASAKIAITLKKLCASGMTVIVATHDMNFAEQVADESYHLSDGVLVKQTTAKILQYYQQ